jgi:L-asparaginase
MVSGPRGLSPSRALAEEIDSWISRREQLSAHDVLVECMEPLLDSATAAPTTWFDLADHLWNMRDLVDGVVILHGTDTLAYTSSALSFLMAGFDRPIVLTGAQIPFSQPESDGEANTMGAIACALDSRIREVCVFFGSRLMRGNRVRKWSTDAADGFLSPHWPVLATFDGRLNVDEAALLEGTAARPQQPHAVSDISVGLVKMYPGLSAELLTAAAMAHPDGLVLELYGRGTADCSRPALRGALERITSGGTPLVGVSQCFRGAVDFDFYDASHMLAEKGIICGRDLTSEAALTKLAYLRSVGTPRDRISADLRRPIAGEVSL